MANFICQRQECGVAFKSKHSTAKYCSRDCSNKVNAKNIIGVTRPRRHSDEEILKLITELATELGRTPSRREFTKHVGMAGETVAYHFGTYNRAVEAAGLVPHLPCPPGFTDSERQVGWSLRFRVLTRDGFRCTYCGGTPKEGYILHVDHVIPKSEGGPTEEGNLVTSCHVCNMGKGTNRIGR